MKNNKEIDMTVSKLHPVALGIAFGIISGLTVFGMGLFAQTFLHGQPIVASVGSMYITYNGSLIHSLLGGVVGFVNAFIAGYVAAWIYNLLIDIV